MLVGSLKRIEEEDEGRRRWEGVVKCAGKGGSQGSDNVKEEQKGVKREEGGFGE